MRGALAQSRFRAATPVLIFSIFITAAQIFFAPSAVRGESQNLKFVGQIGGVCSALVVDGNSACASQGAGDALLSPTPSPTPIPSATRTPFPTISATPSPSPSPSLTPSLSPTLSPTPPLPSPTPSPTPEGDIQVYDIRIRTSRLSDLKCRVVSQLDFPGALKTVDLRLTEANPARIGGTIAISGVNESTYGNAKFRGAFTWDAKKSQCGIRLSVTGSSKTVHESFKGVLVAYRSGNRLVVDASKSKFILKTPKYGKPVSAAWIGEGALRNPAYEAVIDGLDFRQADTKGRVFRSEMGTMTLPWGEALSPKKRGSVETRSFKRVSGGGMLERRSYTMQFSPSQAGRFTLATNWFTPGEPAEFPLQSATYKSYRSSGTLKPPWRQDFAMTIGMAWQPSEMAKSQVGEKEASEAAALADSSEDTARSGVGSSSSASTKEEEGQTEANSVLPAPIATPYFQLNLPFSDSASPIPSATPRVTPNG